MLQPISKNITVTATAVLGTSFTTCTVVLGADTSQFAADGCLLYNQLELAVDFVKGSLDHGDIIVLFSNTESDIVAHPEAFRGLSSESTDGATGIGTVFRHTFKFTANANVVIPVQIAYKYIAFLIGGTGTTTSNTLALYATLVRNITTNI